MVDYRIQQGYGEYAGQETFTYWGYEWALPTFAQCMIDHGVEVSTPGRNSLTNFGTR